MTESLQKLRQMVLALEAELAQLPQDTPEAQEILKRLASDVDTALAKQSSHEFAGHSLLDRLKESAQELESAHPNAAQMFNQIVDTLGHMGI